MLKGISNKISQQLAFNKLINPNLKKYYSYGIELILNDAIILVSIFTIAILFNKVVMSIAYILIYCPLRYYVGGYHCKSYKKCFCTTLSIYAFMLLLNIILYKYLILMGLILLIISVPSIIFILPYNYRNLNVDKKRKCFTSSSVILLISILLFAVFTKIHMVEISFAISWSIFVVLILALVLGVSTFLKVRQ